MMRSGAILAQCAALTMCAALAACGSDDSGSEAGGMTPVEARALDDAAEMLDKQRLPAELASPQAADAQAGKVPATKQ